MKKIALLCAGLYLSTSVAVQAQDPKHKNFYKQVAPIEQSNYKVTFDDMVAKMDYSKFAFKLQNLTNDYILIRKSESSFIIDGKSYNEKEKELIVRPNKTRSGVFKVAGETNYHVDAYSFELGGLYMLPANGTVERVPNFSLPASTNEIVSGDFKVRLKALKKKTKETVATFEVEYLGDDYAIIDPSSLAVTVPDKGDNQFANDARNTNSKVIKKGKKVSFKAIFHISAKYSDMQFANMEILWRNTFQVSKASPIAGGKVDFVLDPGLTEGKN